MCEVCLVSANIISGQTLVITSVHKTTCMLIHEAQELSPWLHETYDASMQLHHTEPSCYHYRVRYDLPSTRIMIHKHEP